MPNTAPAQRAQSEYAASVKFASFSRPMRCYVYKSLRKAGSYVYLAARDDFGRLPEPLRSSLGALAFVLEVDLTPERRLAREDAALVRANLATRGFHLQFPPPERDAHEPH